MQICRQKYNNDNKPAFKSFASVSAAVETNAQLNRALIDAGGVVPWMFQCNNKEEKKERAYNLATFFALAFIAPILNVPAANRITMKLCGLTNGLGDNNHKAIQISNKFLTNADDLKKGLNELSKDVSTSPLEHFYKKLTGKKVNNKLNTSELLKKCGGDYEILRKRLLKAKNYTLASDLLITGLTLGSLGFLNNYLTKKRTGKSGYSAELKMADENIISDRASHYERTKKKRAAVLLAEIGLISSAVPIIVHKHLSNAKTKGFSKLVKDNAHYLDYKKGVYMSRLTMLLGLVMNTTGLLIASRNKTELKDWSIRGAITNPVFFGGDLLLASLIAKNSDRFFGTKLTEPYVESKSKLKNICRKIFPDYKLIKQIDEEVKAGKISPANKKAACGIYWFNLAAVAASLAYVVPAVCNKMIKTDVDNDVKKRTALKFQQEVQSNEVFKDFIK